MPSSGRIRRNLVAVSAGLAIVLGAAGCSSDPESSAGKANTATGGASSIVGTLRVRGGPAPGMDEPRAGTITVYAQTDYSRPSITSKRTDSDGRFEIAISPGTYYLAGNSPDVVGVTCSSHGPVVVVAGRATTAVVSCDIK